MTGGSLGMLGYPIQSKAIRPQNDNNADLAITRVDNPLWHWLRERFAIEGVRLFAAD